MTLDAARDVAIIVLAVLQIIAALLLIVLVFALWRLTRLVRRLATDRVVPILESARETAGTAQTTARTVQGTALFLSNKLVQPAIAIISFVVGVRRAIVALVGLLGEGRRTRS